MKDIITVFNYKWYDKHYILLRMWLHQVSQYNDANLNIKILSEQGEPKNVSRLHRLYNFEWIVLPPRKLLGSKLLDHHNIRFKMWNLSRWSNPFVMLDVDAIPFSPLSKLVEASKDKPWIAINHQDIPKHTQNREPFLNGGVQIVSDPGAFTYEQFTSDYGTLLCPGAEQALIFTHFRKIGYDYSHPAISYQWNACAGYTRVSKMNDTWVCVSSEQCITNPDYKSSSIPDGQLVSINHYWDEFKPWKIDCPMYDTFLKLVLDEETVIEGISRRFMNNSS